MTNKKFIFFSKIFIWGSALLSVLVCLAETKVPVQIENFTNENVQSFGKYWIDNRMSLAIISEPKEYKDVIEMGKDAVSYLIKYLSNSKASIRVAAFFALSEITNKQFGTLDDFKSNENMNLTQGEIENISFQKLADSHLKRREIIINQYEYWWIKNMGSRPKGNRRSARNSRKSP